MSPRETSPYECVALCFTCSTCGDETLVRTSDPWDPIEQHHNTWTFFGYVLRYQPDGWAGQDDEWFCPECKARMEAEAAEAAQ